MIFCFVKHKGHDENLFQIKDSFVEQESIFLLLDFTTINGPDILVNYINEIDCYF